MAYEKTIWKNREVERPRTFEKIENPDGTVTLIPAEGEIIEPGTPIIAENMNKIEQGIKDAHDDLAAHKAENASLDSLGHVKYAVLTATLSTTWSGTSAPYTKTVSVSGILSTDTPIIDVVMSGTYSTDEARIEAWGYIYRAVTADNSITFYAMEKPTVSLPIQIRVVR